MVAYLSWMAAGLAGVAAVNTLINRLTWERGRPGQAFKGRVSVLIPARDEVLNIERCVRAALSSEHPVHEVVVYDDGSTDGTGEVLRQLQRALPRLRVVNGTPLPDGWVGKPHACHQLARHATGSLLLFVDADTLLEPEGVGRITEQLTRHDAQLVTAVPRQVTGSAYEHLVLPLLTLTYTSWLPLALIHKVSSPAVLAANGQLLAIRRDAYDRIGGFRAVRREVVDDMAFCRLAKQRGLKVVFADGFEMARCRMYRSADEVRRGFSKNLYEGVGGSPFSLVAALGLYLLAFVWPYLALTLGLTVAPGLLLPGAIGVGLNLTLRLSLANRFEHRLPAVLLHPIAVLALAEIAVNSWRWSRAGRIRWAGRTYAARSSRSAHILTLEDADVS